jgi:[ribosomal protein S5]-alanine N-acetyltransferase
MGVKLQNGKVPERLATQRLVLRRPMLADAASIFARYASDPEVTCYLGWPRHDSVEQTRSFLAFSDSQWDAWPAGPYLIESRDSGALLGGTGFTFEVPHESITGYVLARDAWGKGYATEALAALMTLCEPMGLRLVYALCHSDHVLSQRVLEKCGFRRQSGLESSEFPNLQTTGPQYAVRYVRTF